MNPGDSAWMLTSTGLVLFMVPGLALFYGGLVGQKNVIAMMAESFVAIGIVTVVWVVIGYSLVFGEDHGGLIGGFGHVMLRGLGATASSWDRHVPGLLFMIYQAMFAVITPALIAGAFTGRMHFRGYLAFIALWSLVIYCPFAHWVWGGGFLGPSGLGAVDFACGAVVHETAGACALAAVLYLGRRRDMDRPHNVPLVILGAGILWFGWFGFNAGSAGSAGALATSALVNTQLGAAAGMVVWMLVEWIARRKPSGVGLATGAVAGLAAITPASGYVPAWAALVVGAAAGVICYGAVQLKYRLRYDDALDVVGVHMVAGAIDLVPRLAEHGIRLSDSQVWRLVTGRPERLNLRLLAVLCEILGYEPGELVRRTDSAVPVGKEPAASGQIRKDLRPKQVRLKRPTRGS
jgi:ammonium transporter, Amt family